ncbi:MAG: hypothetical protein AAFP17_19110 [Pseudomonadota bacterium]
MNSSDVAFRLFFETAFIVVALASIVWFLDGGSSEEAFRNIAGLFTGSR